MKKETNYSEQSIDKYETIKLYRIMKNIKMFHVIALNSATDYTIFLNISEPEQSITNLSINHQELTSFKKIAKKKNHSAVLSFCEFYETLIQERINRQPLRELEKKLTNYNTIRFQ